MNSIFGRININQNPINKTLFNKSIDDLSVFPNIAKKVITKAHWGFGQIIFRPTKEDLNMNLESKGNLKIVSDSKLYNKSEILNALDKQEDSLSDESIILMTYEKWGVDCLKNIIGDFSFAIWDSEKEELFCARDHLGVKPFNCFFDNDNFIFSSNISGILSQSDLNFSVDEQYIADSISIVKSEKFRTTYNEIQKLPPAHYLLLKENKIEIKQYWELKPKEITLKKDDEIIDKFKSILIEAVKCRVQNENNIGTELSGGIDSSSLTAIASQFKKLKTFSHVMPDHLLGKIHPFKDEQEFINLLSNFCDIKERHFIRSEDNSLLDALNHNIKYFKGITQQGFGVFSDHLYESANKENISVLISGFGGDEVVTSKSLGYLTELASNNNWNELKKDLKCQKISKIQQLKTLLKYYLKSMIPFTTRIFALKKQEKPWWYGKFENLALNIDFAERLNIKKRYFLNYGKNKALSLQERNIERITHTHVAQRLEYCSLIARKYGIEYRYPLLDIRLIEYYLAMPPRLKARNGIGRYAIRKAIEGIVPKEIQWRNDKSGATIPTVFMRMINDKKRILEIINRSKSNELIKQYIDLDKYEQWFQKMCNRSKGKQKNVNPGAFYNYLKLILFIENNPNLFK